MSILLQFRAIDTHDPTKGFIQHKRNRNFTTVSCDRHARSYERVLQSTSPVLLCTTKYYSSTSTTKTSTSSTSTTSGSKMSILLQFRAIDTQDLMKGFIQQIQNRQITTVSCDRCVRSYERVAPSTAKSQFYYSFARSIRTILRKGSSSTNEIAILLQFRAIDTHDPTKGSSSKNKIAILLQFRAIHTHDLTKGFIQLRQWMNPYVRSCVSIPRNCSKTTIPQAFSGPWRPPLKNIMLYLML